MAQGCLWLLHICCRYVARARPTDREDREVEDALRGALRFHRSLAAYGVLAVISSQECNEGVDRLLRALFHEPMPGILQVDLGDSGRHKLHLRA